MSSYGLTGSNPSDHVTRERIYSPSFAEKDGTQFLPAQTSSDGDGQQQSDFIPIGSFKFNQNDSYESTEKESVKVMVISDQELMEQQKRDERASFTEYYQT